MQVEIKYYHESDREGVEALGEYFAYTPYQVDPSFLQHTTVKAPLMFAHQFDNPHIKIILAKIDEQVVGALSFMEETELSDFVQSKNSEAPRSATILFVVVHPEFQNKKIAQRLMHVALDQLKKMDVSLVRIGTDYGNLPAMALYQKFDFKVNFSWHTYRLYQEDLKQPEYVVSFAPLTEYPHALIKNRAIPWLYMPEYDSAIIQEYFSQKIQQQMQLKHLSGVQDLQDQMALFVRCDKKRQEYYQTSGSIWMIDDIITNHFDSYTCDVVRTLLLKIPDFLMAETWVLSHDYQKQQFVSQLGMKFVYGGTSLYKVI